jgi:membrane protease subunit (stomatin/prohibitin family)
MTEMGKIVMYTDDPFRWATKEKVRKLKGVVHLAEGATQKLPQIGTPKKILNAYDSIMGYIKLAYECALEVEKSEDYAELRHLAAEQKEKEKAECVNRGCGATGHAPDAEFCYKCGTPLDWDAPERG